MTTHCKLQCSHPSGSLDLARLAARPAVASIVLVCRPQVDDELLQFAISRRDDRDGSKLRALVEAHARYHALRDERRRLVLTLALVSVLLWVLDAWPGALPLPWPHIALYAWVMVALGTAATGVLEWKWYRRRERQRLAVQGA